MTDTIREQIIAAVITSLGDVTIASGYNTDCGQNVLRARYKPGKDEVPCFVVWPQVEEAEKLPGKSKQSMSLKIEGLMLFGDQNPSVISELILGDIRKRMEAQSTAQMPAAGLIESILYVQGGTDEYPEEGEEFTGSAATYRIVYKTRAGDPYSQ
jgi:hypothetical protein